MKILLVCALLFVGCLVFLASMKEPSVVERAEDQKRPTWLETENFFKAHGGRYYNDNVYIGCQTKHTGVTGSSVAMLTPEQVHNLKFGRPCNARVR